MTSLAGLNNLDSIGQGFLIHKNDALTDLTDLHNLSYIGISLKIDSNEVLEDLDGLDNIKTSPIQYLWIYDNHKLSSCSVKFVCDAIAAYYLEIEIHDNAEGCNTLDEVNEKCIIGLDECDLTENIFTLSPNPSSTQITIQTITSSSKFQISIFNLNSQEVIHREVAQSKTVIDISTLPAGVYFVRMTAESAVSIQKFIKID